tara:strand:+ start:156 stop:383 length:228 start_codon:yes stop_codon:yes gene_type:complete
VISINSPNWLALLQPSYWNQGFLFTIDTNLRLFKTKLLVMLAINKTTAAKLIILWNLPALLLLASAYELGTVVFA